MRKCRPIFVLHLENSEYDKDFCLKLVTKMVCVFLLQRIEEMFASKCWMMVLIFSSASVLLYAYLQTKITYDHAVLLKGR